MTDFPAQYARTARFSLGTPRNLQVLGDGRHVLFCRSKSAEDAVLCLWLLDLMSGGEELLVDPAAITSDGGEVPAAERARRERARESASGIVGYSVDAGGAICCFALGGSLFIVDVTTGVVTAPDVGATVYDPRLNGEGTAVAFCDGSALRICTLGPNGWGGDHVLRTDPDPLVSHGRAEFVAAEEMNRLRGYWWSPAGSSLLVTRVDENGVSPLWIADPANPDREPRSVRYPAAGTANATVDLELVGIDGTIRRIDWNDGGRFEYLADVIWQRGHDPLLVRQTRDQRLVSICTIRLTSGEPVLDEVHTITDDTWVELQPGSPRWCPEGLLTIEDTPKVRMLFLDGSPISGASLNIRSIVGLLPDPNDAVDDQAASGSSDDAADAVLVTAWTEPTEIHLVAVPLPGSARSETVLTTEPGVHGGVINGSTLVVTSATSDRFGTRTTAFDLPDSDLDVPDLRGGVTIIDHSSPPGLAADPQFLSLGPDGLTSALFLPSNHDGTTPLPVLLDPYGGPHAQRVLKNHNPHLVSRWFAEQGYAVLVTDGRGTPGRGPTWERAVWGDLATPVLDDQVAALDALLDSNDALDPTRVAIRGWSFGGYLAALALLRRPDRFRAAIAGAPVTAWRLYDTHYTERYLGHPAEHPEHYGRSDLWTEGESGLHVEPLRGELLLIHGLADDNVVAAHTLQLSSALLAGGSPHRVLPLSGVTHMTPQHVVAENLLRLQLDFLNETIGSPTIESPRP